MEMQDTGSAAMDTSSAPETGAEAPAPQQTTDIDGLSEFSFQGQKYTPEKLARSLGELRTLSESSKESAKYRDYVENLEVDLEKVVKNPALAAEFKKMYPKQFHAALDRILGAQRPAESNPNAPSNVPNEFLTKFQQMEQRVAAFEQEKYQAQVSQQEAFLQTKVDPLFEKYPMANQDAVYAKAQAMIEHGYKMTEAAWDRLVRETHMSIKKQADSIRQREVKAQLAKGKEALDTGAGGGAPGQAPAQAKSFKEAEAEAIRQIQLNRHR